MAEQQRQLIMRCWHCQKETKLLVRVTGSHATQSQPVHVIRYCASCNRPNRLELPDNLDVHVFILGRDRTFLGYQGSQSIPIVQGEQDQ